MVNRNPAKLIIHSLLVVAVFNHTAFVMAIIIATSNYIHLIASHILTVAVANTASITTTATMAAVIDNLIVMDTLMDSKHRRSIH